MAGAITSDIHKHLSPKYTDSCPELIKRKEIDLSPFNIEAGSEGNVAYLLTNVFSPKECEALIKHTEDIGYARAMINITETKAVVMPGYRDSQRLMIDNKDFSKILFKRIGHLLPQTLPYFGKELKLVEINERFRFLRYDPGDQFKPHCDGTYERSDGSAFTRITLQIYLNEGFKGGETTFLNPDVGKDKLSKKKNRVPVVPKTGMILVFEHDLYHEGSLLKSGQKYTIRTDVLYQTIKNNPTT